MTDFDDGEEDKIKLSPPWKNAVAELIDSGKYTFGDLIPHKELQAILNLPEPVDNLSVKKVMRWQLAYTNQVQGFSTFLLENHDMCLRSCAGQGYTIVQPGAQTEFAMEDGIKSVSRELRKMHRRLINVKRDALTAEQAKENNDALSKLGALKSLIKKSRLLTWQKAD